MSTKRKLPLKPKRVVIKIGSQLLVDNCGLKHPFMSKLAKQIQQLRAQGIECILVSSGAIGCGRQFLKTKKVLKLEEKQAAAAIGQPHLMQGYEKAFAKHKIITAQILLTRQDMEEQRRSMNAKQTLNCIIKHKILPIINENDTTSVDEISVGDNDILAALIAKLLRADLLILLSCVDGFLDKNHNRISIAHLSDQKLSHLVRPIKSALGTGGMQSKLTAAQHLNEIRKITVVANGSMTNVLLKILAEEDVGTLFCK